MTADLAGPFAYPRCADCGYAEVGETHGLLCLAPPPPHRKHQESGRIAALQRGYLDEALGRWDPHGPGPAVSQLGQLRHKALTRARMTRADELGLISPMTARDDT